MSEIINVEVKITDIQRTFFLKIDTSDNIATVYSSYDEPVYDYHFEVNSTLLSDIVDELKDVKVDDHIIDGKTSLELSRQGRFVDVIKGIVRSIDSKNLFLTVTSLFTKLKKKVKTDVSIRKLLKLILSETIDLDKWQLKIN